MIGDGTVRAQYFAGAPTAEDPLAMNALVRVDISIAFDFRKSMTDAELERAVQGEAHSRVLGMLPAIGEAALAAIPEERTHLREPNFERAWQEAAAAARRE